MPARGVEKQLIDKEKEMPTDRCQIFTGENVLVLQKEINDFLDAFLQTTGSSLRVTHVSQGTCGQRCNVIAVFYYRGLHDFPVPEPKEI